MGNFAPSASGDGSKLGDTVVAWSSYPSSFKITDPVTKIASTVAPREHVRDRRRHHAVAKTKKLLNLKADASSRVSGSLNLDTGDTASDAVNLGGPVSTATPASLEHQLKNAYSEIEKEGRRIQLRPGGTGALTVAKTATAAATASISNRSATPRRQTAGPSLERRWWKNAWAGDRRSSA